MWGKKDYSIYTGSEYWDALRRDMLNLLSPDEPAITTLANAAAFLFTIVDDINWAGFYLYDGEKLVLGPFGGKPACTTIAIGSGVCGSAAQQRQTVIVADVNAFPGHIACDGDSRSEIVVPIIKDETLIGVLDIDSPKLRRFSEEDARGLERIVEALLQQLKLPILCW